MEKAKLKDRPFLVMPAQAGIQYPPLASMVHDRAVSKIHRLLGPRYPGPHENRRAEQCRVDGLASAIFVGASRGDERRK